MLRRRHINADPRGHSARLLRAVGDIARWPFERLAWLFERRLIWPLRERLAGRGPSGRTVGAGALAALIAGAVAVGALWPAGGGPGEKVVLAPARTTVASPAAEPQDEEPQGPQLQGSPPSFGVDDSVGVSEPAEGATGAEAEANAEAAPEASSAASQPEDASGATASSAKPVPAGPAAMRVARRFSEAFVFYEIGKRPAEAKAVFGETAAPDLASALGERPPRLPVGAKVPKARVVNLVPGPRAGKAYTVSVSLLRVGLTSELRLELNKKDGNWLVTDVRG